MNYKGALQDYSQKEYEAEPYYCVIDHQQCGDYHYHTVSVTLGGISTQGRGRTVKAAEQDAARSFLEQHTTHQWQNYKGILLELTHARYLSPPEYRVKERTGPDHAPQFTVRVKVGKYRATAVSSTIREAEQSAAQQLLEVFDSLQ